MQTHTIVGEQMLQQIGGLLGEVGVIRPVVPRTLGRHRLPRRDRRRGDPARRADRLRLRRLERDDDRPLVPAPPAPTTRRPPSCAPARRRISTLASSPLCSTSSSADAGAARLPGDGGLRRRPISRRPARQADRQPLPRDAARRRRDPGRASVAYVRQKKMAIKEDIRFYADEGETQELFRIKARSIFDIGGARYDVFVGEEKLGVLEHQFRASLLRSTWTVRGSDDAELMIARRAQPAACDRAQGDRLRAVRRVDPDPVQLRLPDRRAGRGHDEPQVPAPRPATNPRPRRGTTNAASTGALRSRSPSGSIRFRTV